MEAVKTPNFTQEDLHRLFEYKDGFLYHKAKRSGVKHMSKVGHIDKDSGYTRVSVFGVKQYVHRIVYYMHYGVSVGYEIDHIDGDKTNNSVENLRACSSSQNSANKVIHRGNGLPKGVCFDGRGNKPNPYSSRINVNKVRYNLGSYETPELAHECYCLAADLAFGEFSKHG